MANFAERFGAKVGSKIRDEIGNSEGLRRRAVAILGLIADDMDGKIDLSKPNVARVAKDQSAMGAALARLYSSGTLDQYNSGPANRVERVKGKGRAGDALAARYAAEDGQPAAVEQQETLLNKTEKQEVKKERKEAKKDRKQSLKYLSELSTKTTGLLASSKLLLGFGGGMLKMIGQFLSRTGEKSSTMSNFGWAGLLLGARTMLGGEKGNVFGDLRSLLPKELTDMMDKGIDAVKGVVGDNGIDVIKKLLVGGAAASAVGLTPGAIAGNIGGDLMDGNFLKAIAKLTALIGGGSLLMKMTDSKDPMGDIAKGIDDLSKTASSILDTIKQIWTEIGPYFKQAMEFVKDHPLLTAAGIGALMTGIPQAAIGGIMTGLVSGLMSEGALAAMFTNPAVLAALAGGAVALWTGAKIQNWIESTDWYKKKVGATPEEAEYNRLQQGLQSYNDASFGMTKDYYAYLLKQQGFDVNKTANAKLYQDYDWKSMPGPKPTPIPQSSIVPPAQSPYVNPADRIALGLEPGTEEFGRENRRATALSNLQPNQTLSGSQKALDWVNSPPPVAVSQPVVVQQTVNAGNGSSASKSGPNQSVAPTNSPGSTTGFVDTIENMLTGFWHPSTP